MKQQSNCDTCVNYVYDEDYENYTCEASLDEDDMANFLGFSFDNCPYYSPDDDYRIVSKPT